MKPSIPIRQKPSAPLAGAPELFSPLVFWISGAALVAAVFAVYSPALDFQFILDDHRFVNDPRVQSYGHLWDYFANYVWAQIPGGPSSFYRPLFVLWVRLNFILSEMSPWGWHLLSIAKHVFVAVLLGLLAWKLLRDRTAALLAAGLFALHPAHTESVAWVTVPDPLMSAAVLGALLLYLKYASNFSVDSQSPGESARRKSRKGNRTQAEARPSVGWLIAAVATCLAALLAKETAIVLPVIIFALAIILPCQEQAVAAPAKETTARGAPETFRSRLVYAVRQTIPFLCVTAVYLLLRLNALGGRLGALTQHLPWSTVILSWPATLWFYVKVLIWPVRLRAFADPSQIDTFSVRGVLLPGLAVCCAGAIFGSALFWAWKKARDLPPRDEAGVKCALLLGTLLLVLPLLPALNLNALNPGDFLHGRYTYLPSAGLMLLLATGWHLAGKSRAALLFPGAFVMVAFAVLTVQQEAAWKDDLTVFTVAHQVAPHNEPVAQNLARAHVQVALKLDEDGRCNEAMPVFEQVTQQYPEDWYAWAGLGDCYVQLKDLPRAEQSLRRAAELSHEPRVAQQWQQVRAKMGMAASEPPK